jgi:FkbM family methyltransferase
MIGRLFRRIRANRERALLPIKQGILGDARMVGVDVGSAEGMQPHWRAYVGVADLLLFEPHAESLERLRAQYASSPHADKLQLMPVALSGCGGERSLYMLNCPTGSSLLPVERNSEFADPEDSYIYPVHETQIQTRTLADVMDSMGMAGPDIIKLDVQGAELEILQGMGEVRRRSLLLAEAEVNIGGGITRNFSLYKGSPTWAQLEEQLVSDGMRLLDISVARAYRARGGDDDWYQREIFDVYRNSPTLSAHAWEADVVYVRDWRDLVKNGDTAAIRKLVLALCGYRFFGEAYFLVEKAEQVGVLDADAAKVVKDAVAAWHRVGRRAWHGRGGVWRRVRQVLRLTGMSQLLRWKQYMWFDYPSG